MQAARKILIRSATHAGSWYDGNAKSLDSELAGYLADADLTQPAGTKLKALIGPHAGLRYSGPTAGWAYKNMAQCAGDYNRVVLMGPSHKVYLDFIATTVCDEWETPLGNVTVDREAVEAMCKAAEASDSKIEIAQVRTSAEENEHSLEMHLPFIEKVFQDAGKKQ